MSSEIRSSVKEDIQGIKEVLDSSELFPSEYLDEMISEFFENPECGEIWFSNISDSKVLGFGYCIPEKLTEGTYNLLAIAMRKELQGQSGGIKMIDYVEKLLSQKGHRILIVETSSDAQFELTRKFYEQLGYLKEAVIRDFWAEGVDKVVFWKKLK